MASSRTFPDITDAHALAETLARLCDEPYPEKTAGQWRARCPNHQGHSNTSLHLTPDETDTQVLLHCFGGCTPEQVVQAMGLHLSDLYVTRERPASAPKRQITHVYDYYTAEGTLIHQTVRFAPKGFAQRRPDPATPGSFLWNLHDIETVLYHLPRVLAAIAAHEMVYLVEGEKDADTLAERGMTATTNPMGAKYWRPHYTNMLRGAHITLLADHDPQGRAHVEHIAQALLGQAASVKICYAFHTNEPHSDVSDWIAAGGTRADFETILEQIPDYTGPEAPALTPAQQAVQPGWPTTEPPTPPSVMPGPGRVIEQHRHLLPEVIAQAADAVLHMPGAPLVFQRARRLVAIAPAEKTARGILRVQGTPIISALTAPRLRAILAQAAAWLTPSISKKDREPRPDMPQPWVVETLLDQEDWPFPPLTGLVNSPTMRPDGSLILTPGYDADTGLWMAWQGDTFPAVLDHPTHADAQTALGMLAEPFQDFPFVAPHACSATIAAILTLVARYAVRSVPLFAIRATTRGSGKTLLADCIAMIATGRTAPKMPQVQEEEEERKRLLALALDGDPLVVIDNVVGALGNPALDLAVTSQLFKDRLLGKNATKEAPLHTVFLATGNNMFFKGDMARRAIPIDITPLVENPEERDGFAHPRLLTWLAEERPRLISAALTLLRAYWVAGKPPQPIAPYGSFEEWSDLIRAALVWAGAPDPCLGREGLEADSDETFDAHNELLEAWWTCYGHRTVTLIEMIGDIQERMSTVHEVNEWDRLREALGFFDPQFDGGRLRNKAIGKALKRLNGRVIDRKRLRQDTQRSNKGVKWHVEEIRSTTSTPLPSSVFNVNSVNTHHYTREKNDAVRQNIIEGSRAQTHQTHFSSANSAQSIELTDDMQVYLQNTPTPGPDEAAPDEDLPKGDVPF